MGSKDVTANLEAGAKIEVMYPASRAHVDKNMPEINSSYSSR